LDLGFLASHAPRNGFVTGVWRRFPRKLLAAENASHVQWLRLPLPIWAPKNGKGTTFATSHPPWINTTQEKAAMHHVEFVGGPLDGHRHTFWHKPSRLPAVARLTVSPDVIRVLTGEKKNAAGRGTSTAIYNFAKDGKRLRYYHSASVAVESEQTHNA
jgi:hypothetical protein